jgi:membrane glycosyltransferase
MIARRLFIVLVVAGVTGGLLTLLWHVLAPGGWTLAKLAMLVGALGTVPWTGLCLANGLLGFLVLLSMRPTTQEVTAPTPTPRIYRVNRRVDKLLRHPPFAAWRRWCWGQKPWVTQELTHPTAAGRSMDAASHVDLQRFVYSCSSPDPPPMAVVVTVRSEDLAPVLARLLCLLDALPLACPGWTVAAFVLSDTSDLSAVAAEQRALAALAEADRTRICYRRRADNAGFKAGNIMEFLDHHATGFETMLVLDADSSMTAAAVLRLARAMQADPRLGIVQHLTVGEPAASPFARLFQFGMRAGMRTWAAGQDWWQGDAGPYWGHNALVRIAPFRAHARLKPLPDGRHILSHDQMEAALLRGAGWGVRVLADEDGSFEAFPPALPEHLRRELRWLAGNLQYVHLLRLKGLQPMGRWQLVQAILLFASAPFCLLFLLGAAAAAATDHASAFPVGAALALTLAWSGALYAPKLLGYLEVLISRAKRARYGGAARFLAGMLAETLFTLTYDAIGPLSKTIAIVRLGFGARPGWGVQNRSARGVGWGEAIRLCWPHTLLGIAVFAAFASAGGRAVLWALPFAGGLLVAVPFAVFTADWRVGRWLRRHGIAAVPEEIAQQVTDAAPDLQYTSPAIAGEVAEHLRRG